MNRLSDIIEMGGNLYEEAWNNGRREALREINSGKFERLEEINASLRGQIDSYEKIRLTQDEEIHQMKDALNRTGIEVSTLRGQIESYERTSTEASKEIDRLTAKVQRYEEQLNMLHEMRQKLEAEHQETTEKLEKAQQENACLSAECDLLDKTAGDLRKRLEDAEAKIREQAEALAVYREPTPAACPFCGGRPDVVAINKERWVVTCHSDTCAVNPETDAFDTAEEAVSAWNHRAGGLTCDWR